MAKSRSLSVYHTYIRIFFAFLNKMWLRILTKMRFTNNSTKRPYLIQSTWMNAEYETSHALAYKEQICEHEPARGEKNARVFCTPSRWGGAGYLFKHTLWLPAYRKRAQDVHSLAAAPCSLGNIQGDSKRSEEWSALLGKLLSQRFGW